MSNNAWPGFECLHEHLHREGKYYYLWTDSNRRSTWSPVAQTLPVPTERVNVYFGVHPTKSIPSRFDEKAGGMRAPEVVRASIEDVSAINCLFAEFDIAQFFTNDRTVSQIQSIQLKPSYVVSSGGGYHCYWFLRSPYLISGESALLRAKTLQYGWVNFTKGDPGAKDLARVLRVPGTLNVKPKYAPDFPTCRTVFADLSRQYELEQFETLMPPPPPPRLPRPPVGYGKPVGNKYIDAALKNETDRVLRACQGERNATLVKSAFALGRLVGQGLDAVRIETTLLFAATVIGLPESESLRTIRSGITGRTE